MKERRRFSRLQSKERTSLQKDTGQEKHEGLLLDVSPGGMRILLNREIKVGSLVSGQFKILPHSGHFYTRGEVAWARPVHPKDKNSSFEVGVKFSKVSAVPF